MGYSTNFSGKIQLNKKLSDAHFAYLEKFAETRRMKRNPTIAEELPDPIRTATGLPIGVEGGYFVGGLSYGGQAEDRSVTNNNVEPEGQPGLWCQWIPTHTDEDEVSYIEWDGGEKFYNYVEWLEYIIEHFLKPWGYVANGEIIWQGEEMRDRGKIIVNKNKVKTKDLE